MDRYVVREPRSGADYPRGNQMIAFPTNAGGNNMITPDMPYFAGAYTNELMRTPGYMGVSPHVNMPSFATSNTNVYGHGQVVSGIDPNYLSAYSENSASFIVTGQQLPREQAFIPNVANHNFGSDYQNRNVGGMDRNRMKTFTQQILQGQSRSEHVKTMQSTAYDKNLKANTEVQQKLQQETCTGPTKKLTETNVLKNEYPLMTRNDKLKALYKTGTRVFSGPVEKVLKWHKALQDIGVLVIYEIVAKCVSVRPGESCAKNLVVRDDNGPAVQVVYYEIDFLLPELKPPCTVRVIGKIMTGTSRLQAFHVRPATGDDVATLPRRAAVAAHHVAKLCKEYGHSV